MNKLTFLHAVLFTALLTNSLYSQKSFMKYGKISDEEYAMVKYSKDTTAGAVVLGNYGYTKFSYSQDNGFTMEYSRHVRIKILDKKELDQANFQIMLYVGKGGDEEKLATLKAYTSNIENGKEVNSKLEKSMIFDEMSDKNHKVVKFSLPNVKVGSILEVTYKISSPYLFNLKNWRFQSDIPTVRSEYHVYVPEYFTYKNWTTGYVQIQKLTDSKEEKFQYRLDAQIDAGGRTPGENREFIARVDHWSYIAENIPAFIPEPFITTVNDYLSYVEFELISVKYPNSVAKYYTTTWENINTEMMDEEDFGKQLKRGGHLKEIVAKINTTNPESKMILAYEAIKNKLVWDGRYRPYASSGIAKAFKDGGGSSADINLNLVALLRELGLTSNPVIVSTRSNGMLKPGQVILSQFDHVIAAVQVKDKQYLLDATDPYCPYYMLPPNTLNDKGFMISETGYKWVDLYSKLPYQKTFFSQVAINNDLDIEGKISLISDNFAALGARKDIKKKTNLDEYKKDLETSMGGIEISELKVENIDSLYKPLKIVMDVKIEGKITQGGEMVYFNPIIVGREDENYFKKEVREYPVDFNYPIRKRYTFSITLPAGYQVVEIPKPIKISLPGDGGKFSYVAGNSDNVLTITCDLMINQTIFPSPNYNEIKKFYEMVVSKMAEQVVLKKI